MYGVFRPGGPVGEAPAGLQTIHEDACIALFTKPGSPHGTLSCRPGSVVLLSGEIHNLQEVWPAPDGSGDDVASLHDLLWSPRLLEVLPRLNGSFLIVAWDAERERVLLIPDRYGSRCCFYGFRDGALTFFPLLHYFLDAGFRCRLDPELLFQYVAFRWVFSRRTLVEDVFTVPGGTVAEASAEGVALRRYWSWRFDESASGLEDPKGAAQELGDRLVRAVERSIAGKGRLVVPVSGGLDSRAVLGAVLECRSADGLLAVTYGTPGTFDYELGRRVAKSVGLTHRQIDLSVPRDYEREYLRAARESDGIAGVFWPSLSDWEELADHADDIVVGFMGDMLTGRRMVTAPLLERPDAERDALRGELELRLYNAFPLVARLCGMAPDLCEQTALGLLARRNPDNPHKLRGNYGLCWDLPNRQARFTMELVFKLRERFNYVLPFLDNEFVDFILRVPLSWRVGQRLYKRMLVGRFPRLFALPTTNLRGLPLDAGRWHHLASSVARFLRRRIEQLSFGGMPLQSRHRKRLRRKQVHCFDYGLLMKSTTPFQAVCEAKLERLAERGVVAGDEVRALWSEHVAGVAEHSQPLIVLLCLEFILEAFQDRLR